MALTVQLVNQKGFDLGSFNDFHGDFRRLIATMDSRIMSGHTELIDRIWAESEAIYVAAASRKVVAMGCLRFMATQDGLVAIIDNVATVPGYGYLKAVIERSIERRAIFRPIVSIETQQYPGVCRTVMVPPFISREPRT